MWFWYSTLARLQAADRERDARSDRLVALARKADGHVAQREPLPFAVLALLRLRSSFHHT